MARGGKNSDLIKPVDSKLFDTKYGRWNMVGINDENYLFQHRYRPFFINVVCIATDEICDE